MIYEYCPLSSLSDYSSQYTPDQLKQLVRLYSDRVNRITDKYFIGQSSSIFLKPYNDRLLKVTGAPIAAINSINAIYVDGTSGVLPTDKYRLEGPNLIRLMNWYRYTMDELEFNKIFDDFDLDAITVNAITGIVDNLKQFEVELAVDLNPYDVEAQLVDASGLDVRDVLIFGQYTFIITDIDYTANTVSFDDPGNIRPFKTGTKTTCYGAVPYQIEEVIKLFIKHHQKLQGFAGRIKSEHIGRSYQYDSTGLDHSITGIAEIDSILFLFINDEFDTIFL